MIRKIKKGAIGATLTWIIATLIIFFILILFIAGTSVISTKKVPIEVTKKNDAKTDLHSMKLLSFIMEVPIEFNGKKITTKELIENWISAKGNEKKIIKKKLEKEIEDILKQFIQKDECYFFHIEDERLIKIKKSIKGDYNTDIRLTLPPSVAQEVENMEIEITNLRKETDLRNLKYDNRKTILLNKAATLYIVSEHTAEIKLYIENVLKC